MSQVNLTAQLVRQIENIVKQHDEQAKDPAFIAQYLAAVIGFLLGEVDMPKEQKTEILKQLMQFSQYVCTDVEDKKAAQIKDSEQTMGVWKPGD